MNRVVGRGWYRFQFPIELVMLMHRYLIPKVLPRLRTLCRCDNPTVAFLEAYIPYRPDPNHMAKTPIQVHSFLACPWHRGWSKGTLWQMQQRHTRSQGTKSVMGEEILHHNHWVVSLQTGRFVCIVRINQGPRLRRIYVDLRWLIVMPWRYAQAMLDMLAKLALLLETMTVLLSEICRKTQSRKSNIQKGLQVLSHWRFGTGICLLPGSPVFQKVLIYMTQLASRVDDVIAKHLRFSLSPYVPTAAEGPPKTLCFIQLFCVFLHAVKCRIAQVAWRSAGGYRYLNLYDTMILNDIQWCSITFLDM